MTVLDDIIAASTDPSVPTPDLLRRVQIAAHRLGATAIVAWAKAELTGYGEDEPLPPYRSMQTNVLGLYTGPMQSRITQPLTARPAELEHLWQCDLREPLVEIQALADLPEDPSRNWPSIAVQAYEESGVFGIEFFVLFRAWNVLTRQSLLGMIDVVRSKAMEFALDLQSEYPDAGEVGGPTVRSEARLASIIYNVTNNITGHGTNVATGSDAHQDSVVMIGNVEELRRKVQDAGLDEGDREEFLEAIVEEQRLDGPRLSGFFEKVRSGAVHFATGLTSELGVQLLIALGRAYLGIPG